MEKFKDNAIKPIIAFDFDGTITKENIYPNIGELRPYARQVIWQLHRMGAVIVIWTCRDDDKSLFSMTEFLINNNVYYDTVNTSIQFAPFDYDARKIYAHMYVDDSAFGWVDSDEIMLHVFYAAARKLFGFSEEKATNIIKHRLKR